MNNWPKPNPGPLQCPHIPSNIVKGPQFTRNMGDPDPYLPPTLSLLTYCGSLLTLFN